MREFVFRLEYEEGVDPVADALAASPNVQTWAVTGSITGEEAWRLERATGPEAALAELDPLLVDPPEGTESVSTIACDCERRARVVEREDGHRVVYTTMVGVERCHTVLSLATRYLGDVLCERRRRGRTERWRVLMEEDEKVGLLYDTLDAKRRDGVSFGFERLGDAAGLDEGTLASGSLPAEQTAALTVAVERGYYDTPRSVTLDELADELGVPRSTLSYRLRRAEAALAESFVGSGDGSADAGNSSD
jgi:predicted DNA binding protein